MEKQLKLHYFGCSFTALENSPTKYEFVNYRHIIDRELNATSTNSSFTGKSNQRIFDDVYNESQIVKNERNFNHIFVIQTTFNDRFGLPCDIDDKFSSMCKTENPDSYVEEIQINFYNDWLKYFYSRTNSLKEFKKQVEFVASYLGMQNISYIFIGMDETLDFLNDAEFFGRYRFLNFNQTYSFYKHSKINKLRISDLTNIPPNADHHFNQLGHETLAKQLIEEIKKF
jgi:hypothetical protein